MTYAFEAFGLIVTRDTGLQWNNTKQDDKGNEFFDRVVVAHEISHMVSNIKVQLLAIYP